jgi:hypothetical protein
MFGNVHLKSSIQRREKRESLFKGNLQRPPLAIVLFALDFSVYKAHLNDSRHSISRWRLPHGRTDSQCDP